MRIFLSSTAADLQSHRDLVRSVISDYELICLGMENFGSSSSPPLQVCRDGIASCDAMVCLLGSRYGNKPEDSDLSYVHHEINYARHIGREILFYLLDPEYPVAQKFREHDPDKGALDALKKELSKYYTFSKFTTPENLAYRLAVDLSKNFLIKTDKVRTQMEATVTFRELSYDAIAKWYDCWYQGHWRSNQPFETLRNIIGKHYGPSFSMHNSPSSRILDCACGTGNTFVAFSRAGCEIYGTDGSVEMLKRAKENCLKEHLSTERLIGEPLNWTTIGLNDKKLGDKPFDIIVNTANSFCHIPPTPEFMNKALSNFMDMLRPGGLLIIDTKRYICEGEIAGVPVYKELQFDEIKNEWKVRTDRLDVGNDDKLGAVTFRTRLHYDIDLSFSLRVGRTLILLTVSGEKMPTETFLIPYYPLPARQLSDQMEYAGFSTTIFPALEGPAAGWKYDILVGQKK